LFDEIDADKDGYLVVAEARDFIIRSKLTPEEKERALSQLEEFFQKLDSNPEDGKISFDELIALDEIGHFILRLN
jgi:hypothetical protein